MLWLSVCAIRLWLLLLAIPRLILAGLMVLEAAKYRGHHMSLYLMELPGAPIGWGVIMLGALITAALVQIPVLFGFNAAIGVLISAAVRKKAMAGFARVVVITAEIGLFGLAYRALQSLLTADPTLTLPGETPGYGSIYS